MEFYQGALLIVAVLGIVMLMIAAKTNSHAILNVVLRCVTGILVIYFTNCWAETEGYPLIIGINLGTVLTSTILGFPGIVLLYGIKFYSLL